MYSRMKSSRRQFMKTCGLLSAGGLGARFPFMQIVTENKGMNTASSGITLTYKPFALQLKHTWTIARGSVSTATVVLTELQYDGITGFGEAALTTSARYGETPETVLKFLSKVDLKQFDDPFLVEDILAYVDGIAPGNNAAKASVDIALHDWIGKRLRVPLYKLWGLDRSKTPITTLSIGIDKPEVMQQKVREADEFPVLKIKVGLGNDKEIIEAVRQVTNKPLRVDANEAWKSKELALERILWLETERVEFIEQPMPASQLADIAWLRERVKMPIIADESVLHLEDIPKLKDAFDGINIKLMKCGGLRQAMRMIHTARAMGMKIMMGCMIESSVGVTAAAHLSPLIDYADLDGNLLINNDPFDGVKVAKGKLMLGDGAGLGVKVKQWRSCDE